MPQLSQFSAAPHLLGPRSCSTAECPNHVPHMAKPHRQIHEGSSVALWSLCASNPHANCSPLTQPSSHHYSPAPRNQRNFAGNSSSPWGPCNGGFQWGLQGESEQCAADSCLLPRPLPRHITQHPWDSLGMILEKAPQLVISPVR